MPIHISAANNRGEQPRNQARAGTETKQRSLRTRRPRSNKEFALSNCLREPLYVFTPALRHIGLAAAAPVKQSQASFINAFMSPGASADLANTKRAAS